MTITIETLWAFALEIYARQGVEVACLEAQDRFGADVGLMLLLLFLDRKELAPDDAGWHALLRASGHWQEDILAPLRARRRAAKGTETYDALKAEELAAERAAMQVLLDSLDGQLGKGSGSLRRYGQTLGIHEALLTKLETA